MSERAAPGSEVWRCEGCGEEFDEETFSHARAAHAYECDGSCRNCPVAVECGPIVQVGGGEP